MYGLIFFLFVISLHLPTLRSQKLTFISQNLRSQALHLSPNRSPALFSSVVQPQQCYPTEEQYYQSDFLKHKSDYTLSVGFNP